MAQNILEKILADGELLLAFGFLLYFLKDTMLATWPGFSWLANFAGIGALLLVIAAIIKIWNNFRK